VLRAAASRDDDRALRNRTIRRCSAAAFATGASPNGVTRATRLPNDLVQGWTPDFIPKLTEKRWRTGSSIISVVPVDGGEAMDRARARPAEGIFTGSRAAPLAGALEVCK